MLRYPLKSMVMESLVEYRLLMPGEEYKASEFVFRVFEEFIAPEYSEQGVESFKKYVRPSEFRQRLAENHCCLVATYLGKIIGLIEIRENTHISLLFVDKDWHRKRVSKTLLIKALEFNEKFYPDSDSITVNASPSSAVVYERLGFKHLGAEQVKNGIRFIPMVLRGYGKGKNLASGSR